MTNVEDKGVFFNMHTLWYHKSYANMIFILPTSTQLFLEGKQADTNDPPAHME